MIRSLKSLALSLAAVGMIMPAQIFAAGPVAKTADVRIAGGVLAGRVVDTAGQPSATTVAVFDGKTEVARTQSDANGVYRIQNLRSGVYTVATPASVDSVRLWEGAAPAKAVQSLTLTGDTVVRGQGSSSTALLVGGAAFIAATAAVIIGTTDDDNTPPEMMPATP